MRKMGRFILSKGNMGRFEGASQKGNLKTPASLVTPVCKVARIV
jgi:hypothetical protein